MASVRDGQVRLAPTSADSGGQRETTGREYQAEGASNSSVFMCVGTFLQYFPSPDGHEMYIFAPEFHTFLLDS